VSPHTPTLHLLERHFGPIENPAEARALVRDLGLGLMLAAPLQAVLALASGRDALVDAALFAVTGALLRATESRWAAGIALAASIGSAALAVGALVVDSGAAGGRSILLAMVAVWLAGRGLAGTLALHRFSRGRERRPDRPAGTTGSSSPNGSVAPDSTPG
jgi:hypothetical protein